MTRQVALLRGVNLGPRRRLAMADLRKPLEELGYGEPRTLLQSGNIVLTADATADRLARDLEREVAGRLGIETDIIVRTREELAAVVALDPLGDVVDDPKRYQVSFLSGEPDRDAVQKIAAIDLAPERFVHFGREIYAWHPNGVHRSLLAKLLSDRRLGVTVTARNWNTVNKLLEMAG